MTLQQLYEQIGGSYEQAARVMKVDKLIDRYVCRFEESTVMERLRTAGESMDPEGIFESVSPKIASTFILSSLVPLI